MKHLLILFAALLLLTNMQAQEKFTISGTLKDSQNGEVLIGAAVSDKETKMGATANVYGFYSLTLPKGKHTIIYSYLGYSAVTKEITLDKNISIDVELTEAAKELKEIEITDQKSSDNIKRIEMSTTKLDIKQISRVPVLLGEVDVVKVVQLLPGVTTVGEGATGFNVRGGSIDQNLILLDEAPVYNSSHLFGFFSIFNPDAVKDVKLIKGGIPSQYGGRLSSILDIRMKDGNSKKFEVNGGLGLLFSRLSVEGPLIKNKVSFILAARRSYLDVYFPLFNNESLKKVKAKFYDYTGKINWIINDKNRVYLSGYLGRDDFNFGGDGSFGFNNGNKTSTLRYNHIFNSKMFSNVSFVYSNYDYAIGAGDEVDGFTWKSNIINATMKPEFTYYLNDKNTVTFGGSVSAMNFRPVTITGYDDSKKTESKGEDKHTQENAVYVGNEQTLTKKISIQYGIRFSNFNLIGPITTYAFADTNANVRKRFTATDYFKTNKHVKTYNNFEPRFSAKFEINDLSSIKASYNRMAQYMHLISNTTASTPFDIWLPSTNNILPQLCDQVTAGYFRNFGKNEMFESSLEVFYKNYQNQIDYIDGANLFLNNQIEAELRNGKGRSYGAEVYIKKNVGKFTGWVSYTLSRSERLVSYINNSSWYPTRFNKTHDIKIILSYDITKRINVSANFVYGSGTPYTLQNALYVVQGKVIPYNASGNRNQSNVPDYHRLDISAQFELAKSFKDKYSHNIGVSVYNVYSHRNPFSIYVKQDAENPQRYDVIQFSVLGSLVPSVVYNFKF
jgi:hypothetical protein